METIPFEMIHNWWGGKVKVRKLSPFEDSRGLLMEIIRPDSDTYKPIINMYVSETKPLIKRGPHEHNLQDDEFVTWNSRMVYEFYNPETKEFKYFVTEPRGLFSIYVEHGIHHGYRNLDIKNISYTMNGLSTLYKGFGRNDPADEIRHEKNTTNNKILFIFGAGGRLGKALTKVAYDNVGQHSYEVIPYFDKLHSLEEVESFFKSMDYALAGRDVTFINCAALTNTKDAQTLDDIWKWSNINLPVSFASECSQRNWKFVQLSTDYVYQEVKKDVVNYFVSVYTRSKKEMECSLGFKRNIKNTTVLRVSNLFSNDPNDENIFTRLQKILDEKGSITIDPEVEVAPTDVDKLSLKIVDLFKGNYFETSGIKHVNILTPSYKLDEFVSKFLDTTNKTVEKQSGKLVPWLNSFKNDSAAEKIELG